MKSEQILTESPKSFEDAIQVAVSRFAKTVRNLRSAYVNEMSTVIEGDKVVTYRVNLQMTFEVEDMPAAAAPARTSRKKKRK
ncbi:MAG: dodecin family protein [Hyphomonadaceae bacterium]